LTQGAGAGPSMPKMKVTVSFWERTLSDMPLIAYLLGFETKRNCQITTSAFDLTYGSVSKS
jgi:hypothetical protein